MLINICLVARATAKRYEEKKNDFICDSNAGNGNDEGEDEDDDVHDDGKTPKKKQVFSSLTL